MQAKNYFYIFIAVFGLFLLASCEGNKSEYLKVDRGENYYPLAKGMFWEFTVDSVSYKKRPTSGSTRIVDSFVRHFQVRELVGDTLRDASGRLSYRLERYARDSANHPWLLEDVWYMTKTSVTAERVEEDQRFLKLAFPVSKLSRWNCVQFIDPATILTIRGERTEDAYSVSKGWGLDSRYKTVDSAATINGHSYDSTATVLFANSDAKKQGGINYRYYSEVYAKNVGLVYKRFAIIDTQVIGTSPWQKRADVGFYLIMKLDRFGRQ